MKLAGYEPPFIVATTDHNCPGTVEQLDRAVAEILPGDAVEILMTKAIGVPAERSAPMREDPSWAAMETVCAHHRLRRPHGNVGTAWR